MKISFVFILVFLFYGCTDNKLCGHVYDYDSEKPIKNVFIDINGNKTHTDNAGYFCIKVNSNSACKIVFKKEGYAIKKILCKLGLSKNLNCNKVYMFKKESDFPKN
ncbi:hypothetical protein [Flavobacterium sp. MDT1-60]|uniref:hypothetical protein n=1 Tax=Flavobacterium sp. MDT1-60 TaxID=1979344 RepID=UPI001784A2C5|nr:hypothetical protein [Flavobacterium sp. MDT1-60]QOG01736.1 hypothetical protein IHE43_18300 [Flavobacterium sp. MDT1-60]